ncbi:TRAP transporter small membrane protein DctQ domain-containing protein [Desulfonema limicola]|uniref:TRAP transporter small membrane protein DctQ domain-containing protein n=1 Tax=Desulfonema limicola TaxID=45656 RepID=A0A975B4G1_9BACT|nr:TRAP transporter small permease [Desulfonema limicola]QTA78607.1 TRAP transporter small membrane protein DctQ domain-containing protein [Desulfonema limicola]
MIEKLIFKINNLLILIAGVFLTAMILLTCGNIFLRIVWVPIRGTFELMGFFGALVTTFALGYTQLSRGHIAVDVLFRKFSSRTVSILSSINNIICMAFFAVMAWQLFEKGSILFKTGEVTETLRIIYYPFTYGTALGCGFLALVFLGDLIKIIFMKNKEAE